MESRIDMQTGIYYLDTVRTPGLSNHPTKQ